MQKNIMVIDDEESVRKSFELALEDTGYDVLTVSSGEAGVKKFDEIQPDLIFLDLKMPGMNGVETLKALRRKCKEVPIYIVTAFHKEFLEQLNGAVKEGHHFELLNKPVGADQIQAVVIGALEGATEY